jgi:carbon storage regulator CsrA
LDAKRLPRGRVARAADEGTCGGNVSTLVLSQKSQEAVAIGVTVQSEPTLIVTVLEIRNGRVRLGFEAAKNIPAHRQEVWDRIRDYEPLLTGSWYRISLRSSHAQVRRIPDTGMTAAPTRACVRAA